MDCLFVAATADMETGAQQNGSQNHTVPQQCDSSPNKHVTKKTKIPLFNGLTKLPSDTAIVSLKELFLSDLNKFKSSFKSLEEYLKLQKNLGNKIRIVKEKTRNKYHKKNHVHQRPSSARNARRRNDGIKCVRKHLNEVNQVFMSLYIMRDFLETLIDNSHSRFSLSLCHNFIEWQKKFLEERKTISESLLTNVATLIEKYNVPYSFSFNYAFKKWCEKFEKERQILVESILKGLNYFKITMSAFTQLEHTSNEQFQEAIEVLKYLKELSDLITLFKNDTNNKAVETRISILIDFFLRWSIRMNSDVLFVSEITLPLNWLMYTAPSYKNLRVMIEHCRDFPLVSVGSGFGMLEKILESSGVHVTTIELSPDIWESVHCSNKMPMEQFQFSKQCVLFIGFPGKADHPGVITPKGLCNYTQTLVNCVKTECLKKLVVTYDGTVTPFLVRKNEDKVSGINVGTKQLWDYIQKFFKRRKHGPSSSFYGDKFMTEFTLSPQNALKMLEQAVIDGYDVPPLSLAAIASSVIVQKQEKLSEKQKKLISLRCRKNVYQKDLERYQEYYFAWLPVSDLFDNDITDNDYSEIWSYLGKDYQEDLRKKFDRMSQLTLEIKSLEKDFM